MQKKTKRILKIIIEISLIALVFTLFFLMLDFEELGEYFLQITFPVLLGLICFQLAIHGLGTVHWVILLRQIGSKKSIFSVFMAKLSGFAVSYITPSLYLGGEPVRAGLIKDDSIKYRKLLASVVLDKYIELFAKLPCIITGFALLIILIKPDLPLILISAFFIAFFLAFFIFLLIKLFTDRSFINRFLKSILKPFLKLRPKFAEKAMKVINEFENSITKIIREKKAFYMAVLIAFAVSIIQVFQTYYIISFLKHPNLTYSFIIFFSSLLFSFFSFIPGNIGGAEAVHIGFFRLLGMTIANGLMYSIMLRMGQLVSIAVGLLNILFRRIFKRGGTKSQISEKGADRIRTGE